MNSKNNDQLIEAKINSLLNAGFIDKDEIVNKVVEEFGINKPVIRRVMDDMVIEFNRKSRVLTKQYDKDSKHE